MKNLSVAWKLKEIAELLELLGESSFKVKAYRQAAQQLEELTVDIVEIARSGQLTELPGIGKSIAGRIEEILREGDSPYLWELRSQVPEGLQELLSIPGLGPKLARRLRDAAGVTTIAELEALLSTGKIREIPGFDRRTEGALQRGLQLLRTAQGKVLLGLALPYGRELLARLSRVPGVQEIQIVGSARRYCESISDLDLLAAASDGRALLHTLTTLPGCREVLELSEKRARIRTAYGIQVELAVVPPEDYALTLVLATGAKPHLRALEGLAGEKGWRTEYDHWWDAAGQKLIFASEAEIYWQLNLSYIIPELREEEIVLSAAREGWLPASIELTSLKGDLHLHTRWSDGVNTLEEMVAAGRALGYQYMAIADHSRSLRIAKGMSVELLKEQMKAIDELNAGLTDFRVLKGIEVDILKDGTLDYPDELLAELDVVVASIHSGFAGSEEALTGRIVRAMQNPHVDIIAHPTGRLIQRREPYQVNIERLLQVAQETGTVLEINATPDRLDLCAEHARLCKAMGVKVAINTDAHSTAQLYYMEYGVGTARRGWLEAADVINTYPVDEMLALLKHGK